MPEHKMSLPFINDGEEFELPKLKMRDEKNILDYLAQNTTGQDSEKKKQLIEYAESVYQVLHRVDTNLTREILEDNTTFDELFALLLQIRMRGNKIYTCPYCKKKVSIWELIEEFTDRGRNKNFRQSRAKNTTTK
jgi:hypothetical protein